MIDIVNPKTSVVFCAQPDKKQVEDETRLLPNTLKTKIKQTGQKTTSAFIDYPIRGLKGDKNSNFYEFLAMGIIPYLAGSLTFMGVFNCVARFLNENSKAIAKEYGNKMALGVLFYGLFKTLSKNLVTTPVHLATGVNTEMPYQNKVYALPKEAGKDASIDVQYQQRSVFDSNEFYRKDLLDKQYFDNVAKKLGITENLQDSRAAVSPIIQNIVSTSNLAKSLSSYAWAATGVALAMQKPWKNCFEGLSYLFKIRKFPKAQDENFLQKSWRYCKYVASGVKDFTLIIGKAFGKSCKTLWKGDSDFSGIRKHAGKGVIGLATLLTAGLTFNTIYRAKSMAKTQNYNVIDKTKESVEI